MSAIKFLVFLGSSREGRMGENVAKCVVNRLKSLNHQVELIDPLTVGTDGHVHQPLHFRRDPSQIPEWMLNTNKKIQDANALVVVTPEYNCSLPPGLTSVMDQFPPASYKHKPCAIVTYSMGMLGGARANFVARPFLSELGMISIPQSCTIPQVIGKFTDNGECSDERTDKKITQVLKELEWYASAINVKKETDGVPE